jgi:iron complex outermembrane receptor protein
MLTQSFAIHKLLHTEVSLFSHLFGRYIYLKPEDELRLTIRGAFPVYTYTQEDAWIRGADIVLVSDFSHHLESSFKYSWIRGTALDGGRSLSLMPAGYFTSTVSWAFHDNQTFKGAKIQLEGEYTAKQKHWDTTSELLPPPDSYFLLFLKFNTGIKINSNIIHVGLSLENLLNVKYRNYLNRLRYFADEQGISCTMNIRIEF